MQERVFTPSQQDALLAEISDACQQIAALSSHICDCHGDAQIVDVLTCATAVLASRAGWLADISRSLIDGPMKGLDVIEDAVYWLIPERGRPVLTAVKAEGGNV